LEGAQARKINAIVWYNEQCMVAGQQGS